MCACVRPSVRTCVRACVCVCDMFLRHIFSYELHVLCNIFNTFSHLGKLSTKQSKWNDTDLLPLKMTNKTGEKTKDLLLLSLLLMMLLLLLLSMITCWLAKTMVFTCVTSIAGTTTVSRSYQHCRTNTHTGSVYTRPGLGHTAYMYGRRDVYIYIWDSYCSQSITYALSFVQT